MSLSLAVDHAVEVQLAVLVLHVVSTNLELSLIASKSCLHLLLLEYLYYSLPCAELTGGTDSNRALAH